MTGLYAGFAASNVAVGIVPDPQATKSSGKGKKKMPSDTKKERKGKRN